jgi:fibronectin type 3 domain-containing protein
LLWGVAGADQGNSTTVELDKSYSGTDSEMYFYFTPEESGFYCADIQANDTIAAEIPGYESDDSGYSFGTEGIVNGKNLNLINFLNKGTAYCYYVQPECADNYTFELSFYEGISVSLDEEYASESMNLYNYTPDESGIYIISNPSEDKKLNVTTYIYSKDENGLNVVQYDNSYGYNGVVYTCLEKDKTYYFYSYPLLNNDDEYNFKLYHNTVSLQLDQTVNGITNKVTYEIKVDTSGIYKFCTESNYNLGSGLCENSNGYTCWCSGCDNIYYLDSNTTYYYYVADEDAEGTLVPYELTMNLLNTDSVVKDTDYYIEDTTCYLFTPDTSGFYSFNVSGDSSDESISSEVYCLNDKNEFELISREWGYETSVICNLTAGNTYYWMMYDDGDMFRIDNTKVNITEVNQQQEVIEEGKEYTVTQTTILAFTPSESKDYIYLANGDCRAELYYYYGDEYNYSDGYHFGAFDFDYCNMSSLENLIAGKTYYFVVKFNSDETGEFKIKVSSDFSGNLTSNKTVTVNGAGVYEFTPTASGLYSVNTNNEAVCTNVLNYTEYEYYNDDGELITGYYYDYVDAINEHYYLIAGTTYYLRTYLPYEGNVNYTLKISPYSPSAVKVGLNYSETSNAFYTFTPEVDGAYTITYYYEEDAYGMISIYDKTDSGLSMLESEYDYDYDASKFILKENLKAGTTYYVSSEIWYGYGKSCNFYISTTLKKPTVTLSNASNGVKVSWTKSAGASGYYVYRKATGDKSWTKIATIKSKLTLSYTDTKASPGTTYYYTVKAYSGTVYSSYETNKTIKYLKQPTVTLTNASNGVKVSWTKSAGAGGYYVYRKAPGDKKWTLINKASNLSYTDTAAKAGTTYYYTVKAYSGKTYSSYVTDKTIKYLAQPTVTLTNTSTGVKISWTESTGAGGYYVYRKTASGSWSRIKTITSVGTTSYTDTTAKAGTTYYYTVKAYSGKTYSSYVTNKTIKRLTQPVVTLSNVTKGVKISWKKITGATGYIVYRKTASGSWSRIKIITSASTLSYTDTTAKSGTTYYYTVKAYSGSINSSYVTNKSIKYKK